jgi:hypothetical protein
MASPTRGPARTDANRPCCALADKTPLREGVSAAYEADKERIRVSDYTVDTAFQKVEMMSVNRTK